MEMLIYYLEHWFILEIFSAKIPSPTPRYSFFRNLTPLLPNDVALDEVNKHITDTLSILRREISKVRKEKKALICIRQAGSGGRQGQFVLLRCCVGKGGRVSKVFKLASVLM